MPPTTSAESSAETSADSCASSGAGTVAGDLENLFHSELGLNVSRFLSGDREAKKFTDLKIFSARGGSWDVHIAVVCSQIPQWADLVEPATRIGGNQVLRVDDKELFGTTLCDSSFNGFFRILLQFLYTGTFGRPLNHAVSHLRLYFAAHKLKLPRLEAVTRQEFCALTTGMAKDLNKECSSIDLLYYLGLANFGDLHNHVCTTVAGNMTTWKVWKLMFPVMERHEAFRVGVCHRISEALANSPPH